jgi:hypothetical protein
MLNILKIGTKTLAPKKHMKWAGAIESSLEMKMNLKIFGRHGIIH